MRLEYLLGALLATGSIGSAATAQTLAVQETVPPHATGADQPVRSPSKPAVISFELRDNLVAVAATINGRRQSAVLDSGASALVVDRHAAEAMALNEGAPSGDVAGAGPQAQQLRPVTVSTMTVGPLRFDNLSGHSSNLEQLSSSAGFPIDVLIGAPAFKHGAVRVDYRRKQVTFGPSGSLGTCAAPIPLTIIYDVPVVEAEIRATSASEPVRLKLVVDLGTRHRALAIGGPFVRSEVGKALIASGKAQQVGHGTGGQVKGTVARIAALRLSGGQAFAGLEAALSSGAAAFEAGVIDGSLGVPLWKAGAITFDYPAKILCIEV